MDIEFWIVLTNLGLIIVTALAVYFTVREQNRHKEHSDDNRTDIERELIDVIHTALEDRDKAKEEETNGSKD